jgi:hypothetical protein
MHEKQSPDRWSFGYTGTGNARDSTTERRNGRRAGLANARRWPFGYNQPCIFMKERARGLSTMPAQRLVTIVGHSVRGPRTVGHSVMNSLTGRRWHLSGIAIGHSVIGVGHSVMHLGQPVTPIGLSVTGHWSVGDLQHDRSAANHLVGHRNFHSRCSFSLFFNQTYNRLFNQRFGKAGNYISEKHESRATETRPIQVARHLKGDSHSTWGAATLDPRCGRSTHFYICPATNIMLQ